MPIRTSIETLRKLGARSSDVRHLLRGSHRHRADRGRSCLARLVSSFAAYARLPDPKLYTSTLLPCAAKSRCSSAKPPKRGGSLSNLRRLEPSPFTRDRDQLDAGHFQSDQECHRGRPFRGEQSGPSGHVLVRAEAHPEEVRLLQSGRGGRRPGYPGHRGLRVSSRPTRRPKQTDWARPTHQSAHRGRTRRRPHLRKQALRRGNLHRNRRKCAPSGWQGRPGGPGVARRGRGDFPRPAAGYPAGLDESSRQIARTAGDRISRVGWLHDERIHPAS